MFAKAEWAVAVGRQVAADEHGAEAGEEAGVEHAAFERPDRISGARQELRRRRGGAGLDLSNSVVVVRVELCLSQMDPKLAVFRIHLPV